ncbi:MAG: hypothetical protein C0592_01485 [Marinilabiliales bacterium]|nr:MAG: hypothetical protein C0592_01485 [Marinilabiliales bacterium]
MLSGYHKVTESKTNTFIMKKYLFILTFLFSSYLFAQTPHFVWVKELPFMVDCQVLDHVGNIYLAGDFSDTIPLDTNILIAENGTDMIIAKYDSTGNLLWYDQICDAEYMYVADLSIDSHNRLLFSGMFTSYAINGGDTLWGTYMRHNMLLIKFEVDGRRAWMKCPGYHPYTCTHLYHSVMDKNDEILLYGNTNYFTGPEHYIIIDGLEYQLDDGRFWMKLDTAGNFLWLTTAPIDVDEFYYYNNNYYVDQGDTLSKYDLSFDLITKKIISAGPAHTETEYVNRSIAIDNEKNMYYLGVINDSIEFLGQTFYDDDYGEVVLLCLDSNWSENWIYHLPNTFQSWPVDMALHNDLIVFTMLFRDTVFINNDTVVSTNFKKNDMIVFVDLDGNYVYHETIYCNRDLSDMGVMMNDAVYFAGMARDSVNLSNFHLNPPGFYETYYLAKMEFDNFYVPTNSTNVLGYPNPFNDVVYFNNTINTNNAILDIYRTNGLHIEHYEFQGAVNSVNLGYLPQGMYIFRLKTDSGIHSAIMMKQ